MNKLLLFPLLIMMLFTAFTFLYSGAPAPYQFNWDSNAESLNNSVGTDVDIPGLEKEKTFDIWSSGLGAEIIIIAVIIIGIAAGFHFLGSGFSEESQRMMYASLGWYGLWGVLSICTIPLINPTQILGIGMGIWVFLTVIYSIGFLQTMQGVE